MKHRLACLDMADLEIIATICAIEREFLGTSVTFIGAKATT